MNPHTNTEIVTDEHGILIKSYLAMPLDKRPRVVYCPDSGIYADGDWGIEVLSAEQNAEYSAYADVVFADGSSEMLHVESLWFDFIEVTP